MPKVSICIPAYNQAVHLKKSIDSVLSQTFTDYEIILTDDSPGNIVSDLVKKYNLPDAIIYFKNKTTLGSPENWNEAIKKSTGEYIKILHHDDCLFNKDSLGKFVAMLDTNPSADFAFAATLVTSIKHAVEEHRSSPAQLNSLRKDATIIYKSNFVGAPSTTIFRRKATCFFDKNLKWLVDIDFYIRMLLQGQLFVCSEEILTVTHMPEGRITEACENNKEVEVFEYFYLFDKLKPFLGKGKSEAYRNALLKLIAVCKKYSLKNTLEIRAIGYKGKIPLHVISFIKLNSLHSITGRAYLKMLNATKSK